MSSWDLSEPRGAVIKFHGHQFGTEADMFWVWAVDEEALAQGLLVITVASPSSSGVDPHEYVVESHPGSASFLFGESLHSDGARYWTDRDYRLIHELLQSHLDGNAAIDHDRIVFSGGSAGTEFLTRFLERYFGVYGGGFHAWCGPFWHPEWAIDSPRHALPWSPTIPWSEYTAAAVAQRWRVFVEATTEDFVFDAAVAMRDYYRDVLRLNTRWDLDTPGDHCWPGSTPIDSTLAWLSTPNSQSRRGTVDDRDGDGLANAIDVDDDNDGALDVIDALPLEPRDWLDTDSDGMGDFADRDADGDGVDNALDPFPLDSTEWRDNDADGIGDNIDIDDDNDGVPDSTDPDPLRGPRNDQLTFKPVWDGVQIGFGYTTTTPSARVHRNRPVSVKYPEAFGSRQSWHSIRLGDGANPVFEIIIDSYERNEPCEEVLLAKLCDPQAEPGRVPQFYYYERWSHKIYIDRNRNRDLTDDGPPLVMAGNEDGIDGELGYPPAITVLLKVPYSTGALVPYGLILWPVGVPEDVRLRYIGASAWMGSVSVPGSEPVLVGTVDANLDGVFDTGTLRADRSKGFWFDSDLQDFACVDTNRDGHLNECDPSRSGPWEPTFPFEPVYEHEPFTLDGRTYTLEVSPTGHTVTIQAREVP